MALRVRNVDVENRAGPVGKGHNVRPTQTRTVLGAITNKCPKPSAANVKELPQKNILTRNARTNFAVGPDTKKTVVSRATVGNRVKTTAIVKKKEVDETSSLQYATPIPMDIDSLSDAFSSQLLHPPNVEDIDENDGQNPMVMGEYVSDIYSYLRFLETHYIICEDYMKSQKEVTSRMRSILVDWLVQVHGRFNLLQETLYLAVACLDRYLQEQQVSKPQLQLVGVTAMYVACKYEEMYAPDVSDFVYITDNAYSKQGIFKMEQSMLKVLRFGLGRPLPLHFLRRNSKAGNIDAIVHTIAKYIMELSLTETEFSHWPPSRLAAAALCLAQRVIEGESWSDTLAFYSGYTESDLTPSVCQLARLVVKAPTAKLQYVYIKYSSPKFFRVSVRPQMSSSTIKKLAALATAN